MGSKNQLETKWSTIGITHQNVPTQHMPKNTGSKHPAPWQSTHPPPFRRLPPPIWQLLSNMGSLLNPFDHYGQNGKGRATCLAIVVKAGGAHFHICPRWQNGQLWFFHWDSLFCTMFNLTIVGKCERDLKCIWPQLSNVKDESLVHLTRVGKRGVHLTTVVKCGRGNWSIWQKLSNVERGPLVHLTNVVKSTHPLR